MLNIAQITKSIKTTPYKRCIYASFAMFCSHITLVLWSKIQPKNIRFFPPFWDYICASTTLSKFLSLHFTQIHWVHLWHSLLFFRDITVFRCLSPFMIGIHIYLEQSVWAELSWNPFWKRIASICFGPNHSGKIFWGKIWIFEKVIFNFSAKIGFFGLTWRVMLL